MRKYIFIIFTLIPLMSNAFYAIVDGIYYDLDSEKKEATVISGIDYTTYMGNIVIPSSIEYEGVEYIVTTIGSSAFGDSFGLIKITIPESVTKIGSSAFGNTVDLNQVNYLGSMESWCKISFDGTRSNGFLWLSLQNAWDNPMFCCGGEEIKDVLNIPETVKTINPYSFCYLYVKQINLYNVKKIGRWAFMDCKKLKDVYCYSPFVPQCDNTAFNNKIIMTATLHVPEEALELYKSDSSWRNFGNIVSIDNTNINNIERKEEKAIGIYSVEGRLINSEKKGINIIRMSDGTIKKVIIK